jgi:thiamine biosynthesis protein ThiS
VINGERKQITHGVTLLALLQELELDPRAVVVEHNRKIVRRPALGDVTLSAGDAIELVHFVGGG